MQSCRKQTSSFSAFLNSVLYRSCSYLAVKTGKGMFIFDFSLPVACILLVLTMENNMLKCSGWHVQFKHNLRLSLEDEILASQIWKKLSI